MALFSLKKSVKKETDKKTVKVAPQIVANRNLSAVIVKPRLTEKAVNQSEQNVYTFEVSRDATKFAVANAVKSLYNVTPVKVNIVNKKPAHRPKGSTNRMVKVPGMKKAYVYLKKGDTINLV
jgi:large subunit ribosomal protein L23